MKKPAILLLFLCLGTVVATSAVEKAGFRNAALIYTHPTWSSEAFKPLIAYQTPDGRYETGELFDCFLFLNQKLNNIRTIDGLSRKSDWEHQLALWFTPGREIAGLNEAAARLRREIAIPRRPLKVLCYIPYPNSAVTDFGDVDGDGRSENLADPLDLAKVINWYSAELTRKFKSCPELEFLGFYWMPEDLVTDREKISLITNIAHRNGKKIIWIPWFCAAGFETWRECGFDAAIMQSNYAFHALAAGGSARSNRLNLSAQICRDNGMGMEVELPYLRDAEAVTLLRRTLAVMSGTGLQREPSAYFFSVDFPKADSSRATDRELYKLSADFLMGRPIVPKASPEWQWRSTGNGYVAEISVDQSQPIRELNLMMRETPENYWRGIARLEGQRNGQWRPLSWAVRSCFTISHGPFQILTLPVLATAEKLRLTLESSVPPRFSEIQLEPENGDWGYGISTGKCYQSDFPVSPSAYADSPDGRKLFDGITGGVWGNYLGWNHSPFGLVFDLGAKPERFDEVRLYTRRDPSGSIRLPENLTAALTDEAGCEHLYGMRGDVPKKLALLEGGAFTVTRSKKDPTVEEGYFSLRNRSAEPLRYLVIDGRATGWAFWAEAEFFLNGKKLNPYSISYRLTVPTRVKANFDDQSVLTDGKISSGLPPRNVLVPPNAKHRVSFQLSGAEPISDIRIYHTKIYGNSAEMPTVTVTLDQNQPMPARSRNGRTPYFHTSLPQPLEARQVTVDIQTSRRPLLLTEIIINQE